jgi:hypothetical protein
LKIKINIIKRQDPKLFEEKFKINAKQRNSRRVYDLSDFYTPTFSKDLKAFITKRDLSNPKKTIEDDDYVTCKFSFYIK